MINFIFRGAGGFEWKVSNIVLEVAIRIEVVLSETIIIDFSAFSFAVETATATLSMSVWCDESDRKKSYECRSESKTFYSINFHQMASKSETQLILFCTCYATLLIVFILLERPPRFLGVQVTKVLTAVLSAKV